jgi:hypothetical protein
LNVINLYGGPGAGKSTTAAGLFYLMKLTGFRCELVTEYAKDLVYSNRTDMFAHQEFILAEQHHRISRLKDKVDWVITDSPLLLSTVYPRDFWGEGELLNKFNEFVCELDSQYNSINYFIKRRKEYQTFGRPHTESQAKEKDSIIENMLQHNNVIYNVINADQHSCKIIHSDVVMLQEEMKYENN